MNTKQKHFTAVCGAVFALTLFLFLGACSQEPIFAAIEEEVKLKEAGIKNIVYSMVEFRSQLYVANGKISTKKNAPVDWRGSSAPGFTIRLAVGDSGNSLYALTAHVTNESDPEYSYAVWYSTDAHSWSRVSGISEVKTICDNGVDRAFVVTSAGTFLLQSGSATGTSLADPSTVAAAKQTGTSSGEFFWSSTGFTADGDNLYRMNGGTSQYSSNGSNWADGASVSVNGNKTIAAAVYTKANGEKFLLVGTTSGARAIKINTTGALEGGAMELKDAGLGDNAASVLNNAYTFADGLYVFDTTIFSAAVHPTIPTRSGLWGYYGTTWDRE